MPRIFLDFFVENFCNNRFAFIFNQQTTRIVLFFQKYFQAIASKASYMETMTKCRFFAICTIQKAVFVETFQKKAQR